MIINAKNLIAGRLGAYVAKHTLLGETISIVNAELAVITGNRKNIFLKYKRQSQRGEPTHGPFLPKMTDRFLKRLIRGMLPYKQWKGREALRRIKCYNGVPLEFQGKEYETVQGADITKMQKLKYVTIQEICNHLKHR